MKMLVDRMNAEAEYLGKGMVRASFLNQLIDPMLIEAIGVDLACKLVTENRPEPTKVLTAETGGIVIGLAVAWALHIPFIFARKSVPVTMVGGVLMARATSRTGGGRPILLAISRAHLSEGDWVYVVDDFLATGTTAIALTRLVWKAGAGVLGVGVAIEKVYEDGRRNLRDRLSVPIVSLARVDLDENGKMVIEEGVVG